MILIVLVTIILAYLVNFYWKVSKYPRGPFPLPIFGNAFQINPKTLHLDLERFHEKYGDVYTVWLMFQPLVVFHRDGAIREAFVTKGDNFLDRMTDFPDTIFQSVENGGVIQSSGANWREQRRNALHILRDFGVGKNIIEQQIQEQLEKLVEEIRKSDMNAVDFHRPLQITVANIINQLLFGYSYKHDDCDRLLEYSNATFFLVTTLWESKLIILAMMFPAIRYVPIIGHYVVGRHVDNYQWCMQFVKKDIERALKGYDKEMEPSCFVQAYYQKLNKNEYLTMEQLENVCSDFFLAGMETTSTTLRWAVLFLAQNQEVQEKLRKEIGSVVGFSRLPSLRDKNSMPYTNATLAELQRRSNIVPLNPYHKSTADTVVGGKFVPAGTRILAHIWAAQRDPEVFPNPDCFSPERFLNKDGSLNQEKLNMVISFGIGKRQCAGESLARTELFLGLTTLVQKFHLHAPIESPLDITPTYGTVLTPKKNLLRVTEVDASNY